ncbi:hypothetical protein RJ40_11900 [Methanofollis aquaemaris]|uniref:Uncharacterized protein n=1 Tax=Methanofollis aquaemaris TaxID=126734 RepID=A0A8A3S7N7_9EURY|nr:hypothetical protein [Methanofollis aquaemaris]QSZ68145.1 hypothetical protein RJ40_11900 [Methanofollis aquaemaris]
MEPENEDAKTVWNNLYYACLETKEEPYPHEVIEDLNKAIHETLVKHGYEGEMVHSNSVHSFMDHFVFAYERGYEESIEIIVQRCDTD